MMKTNGLALYRRMAELKLLPEEVAKRAGVAASSVYKMKKGYLVRPDVVGKVAEVLNLPIDILIIETKEGG